MMEPSGHMLRDTFPDADVSYAGTVVSNEKDIRFQMRCQSASLKEAWILSIHVLRSDNWCVLFGDVKEEQSGGIWWQSPHMRAPHETLEECLCFIAGGLFSGTRVAIERCKKFKGDCAAMQVDLVMSS
jgi:hypothetical protein